MEALIAVVLLGVGAAAAATGQAWAARALARAEAREDAAAAAELVLDSLVQEPRPGAGAAAERGIALQWQVTGTAAAGEALLQANASGRGVQLTESWGVVLAAPPPLLGSAP